MYLWPLSPTFACADRPLTQPSPRSARSAGRGQGRGAGVTAQVSPGSRPTLTSMLPCRTAPAAAGMVTYPSGEARQRHPPVPGRLRPSPDLVAQVDMGATISPSSGWGCWTAWRRRKHAVPPCSGRDGILLLIGLDAL